MELLHDFAWFWGGAFLANATPHYVSGMMGRPFPSPFTRPMGQGLLSTSIVNVRWGLLNLLIGYLLICRVGDFDLRSTEDVAAVGLGVLLMSDRMAFRFGRFFGGNDPPG